MTTNSLSAKKNAVSNDIDTVLFFYLLADSIFIDLFHYKDFDSCLQLNKKNGSDANTSTSHALHTVNVLSKMIEMNDKY